MATYEELRQIASNEQGDALRNKLAVAVTIKAESLLAGTPTATQIIWAGEALNDPVSKVMTVLHYLLAKNKGSTVAAITGVNDAALQTATDEAIDKLVV